jgi:hypothetical protein
MDLKDIGCESLDWIQLAQNRVQSRVLVGVVMNLESLLNKVFFFLLF